MNDWKPGDILVSPDSLHGPIMSIRPFPTWGLWGGEAARWSPTTGWTRPNEFHVWEDN